jgi:hypothetical protein
LKITRMVAARRRVGMLLLLLAAAVSISWPLADLEAWAEDEAGTLWQATDIASGHLHRLGLSSSTGIRNMIGAALLAVPFSWLPDLLSISRALALIQLLALVPLGLLIGRTPAERALAVALLWFTPTIMLSSFSLWNQYLARLIGALLLALLIYLIERRGTPRRRTVAILAYVGLALFQPAVHLVHFPDLAIHLLLLLVVLTRYPAPLDSATGTAGAGALGFAASVLYVPWVVDTAAELRAGTATAIVAMAIVTLGAAVAIMAYGPRRLLDRILAVVQARAGAALVVALLWLAVPAVALFSVHGTAIARRLARSATPLAVALLATQLAVVIALLPRPAARSGAERAWHFLSRLYGNRAPTAALLLSYAALLAVGRFLLGVTPWQRSDLWVSMMPAVLAPALLLGQTRARLGQRPALAALAAAFALLAGLALFGPGAAYRHTYPTVVQASEMRLAVEAAVARHRAEGDGARIDLSYDLGAGKEWIPKLVTWHPAFRWYSIGRPYDWLLRRRHGLLNLHDGEIDRTSGGKFQLGFRGTPYAAAEWDVVERFDRLELRRRR